MTARTAVNSHQSHDATPFAAEFVDPHVMDQIGERAVRQRTARRERERHRGESQCNTSGGQGSERGAAARTAAFRTMQGLCR